MLGPELGLAICSSCCESKLDQAPVLFEDGASTASAAATRIKQLQLDSNILRCVLRQQPTIGSMYTIWRNGSFEITPSLAAAGAQESVYHRTCVCPRFAMSFEACASAGKRESLEAARTSVVSQQACRLNLKRQLPAVPPHGASFRGARIVQGPLRERQRVRGAANAPHAQLIHGPKEKTKTDCRE